ncbi:serine/threonine-protein kinase [Streptomyces sp. NPDC048508]|uniref:serine/threonine-protein kinase n=1 Tax=Streptomyces sp. NPDC048508 TaxID=3365561 RepID=UPI00371A4770
MSAWTVAGYTELRELGSGASGRVVLAIHKSTGTPVAVKYLSEALFANPSFISKFRTEAHLLSDLESQHIVRLYEYVETPVGAAIVMELVDGVTLRALLRREGRLEVEAALVLLKGSLLGLAAAHKADVVHRDYKPENVLIKTDGASKLADFGIAVDCGTMHGAAGTPAYMAPEQWNGQPASPAADVYAATATFYECLVGVKPFSGDNFAELALKHLEAPIPHSRVPLAVQSIVLRGLAKNSTERPSTAEDFVEELESTARAVFGTEWEERGQQKLATLVALFPLLLPLSESKAVFATDLATTGLQSTSPARVGRWNPGMRGVVSGAVALVLGVAAIIGTSSGKPKDVAASGQSGTTMKPGVTAEGWPSDDVSTPAGKVTSIPESEKPPVSASESGISASETPVIDTSTGSTMAQTELPPRVDESISASTDVESPSSSPSMASTVVTSVTTKLSQISALEATATFEITTDGAGPITFTASWYSGNGEDFSQDGEESFKRSGATKYSVTVRHVFNIEACYWMVKGVAQSRSINGTSSQKMLTRQCSIS